MIPYRYVFLILSWILTSVGCGGGGGGSRVGPISVAPFDSGGVTVLVGDNSLAGIAEVNLEIDQIVFVGAGGQLEVVTDNVDIINLLDLQNITLSVANVDVPSRMYNTIRVSITSIEVVEDDDDVFLAQLPANGTIELNPESPFEVEPDEDLVVQLDFDLRRSLQLVSTGNSPYRFRPVIFIDVVEDGNAPRLSRLLGTVEDDAAPTEVSDFDLCDVAEPDRCVDVDLSDAPQLLLEDGDVTTLDNIERGAQASVFGRYDVADGLPNLFVADIVVLGNEDSLVQIDGEVVGALVNDAFEVQQAGGGVATTVSLSPEATLFDAQGELLADDIALGQNADVWGQRSQIAGTPVDEFVAFAVQIGPAINEDSLAGALDSIADNELMVTNPDGTFCVQVSDSTTFQLIRDFDGEAETELAALSDLTDFLADGTAVQVNGFGVQGAACLDATVVVAEID